MRIFVDAMGGDYAPQAPVEGAVEALRRYPNIEITLAGDLEQVEPLLKDCDDVRGRITLLHAPEVITNHESPVMGVRTKKNSATVQGMLQLKEKQADGFVSAGSTGAVLAGGMFRLGRIEGVERPALAPLLPTAKGPVLLIDCGANAECTPEYLLQFAYMGSFYARRMMGLTQPRVGLLNIGAEETKGGTLQHETYKLLKKASDEGRINFVGNVEGSTMLFGGVDVVVSDGFSGNIVLKTAEGVAKWLFTELKEVFMMNTKNKLAAAVIKKDVKGIAKKIDSNEVGGTAFGISKPVIKAHGSSGDEAFFAAIRQAKAFAEADIVGDIEKNIDYMKISEEA